MGDVDPEDDWPDDMLFPLANHGPGECGECDHRRRRALALASDEPDPGPSDFQRRLWDAVGPEAPGVPG